MMYFSYPFLCFLLEIQYQGNIYLQCSLFCGLNLLDHMQLLAYPAAVTFLVEFLVMNSWYRISELHVLPLPKVVPGDAKIISG